MEPSLHKTVDSTSRKPARLLRPAHAHLPHESMDEYKTVELSWCKAYSPNNETEYHMVTELVNADWFLQRVSRAHASVEESIYQSNPDPATWTEEQQRTLARHMRYKTAASNLVDKKRKACEDYRKARKSESESVAKMALAKERLEVYKKKNRPEETWQEHLISMKKQAMFAPANSNR